MEKNIRRCLEDSPSLCEFAPLDPTWFFKNVGVFEGKVSTIVNVNATEKSRRTGTMPQLTGLTTAPCIDVSISRDGKCMPANTFQGCLRKVLC